MSTKALNKRNWGRLFVALHLLLISQIVWWAIVFSRYVNTVKDLKLRNAFFEAQTSGQSPVSQEDVEKEAFHQKTMFLSESAFFAVIASLALWLLFQALKKEEKSREIQRNFIEVLTHESKTPLTALKLLLESAKEKLTQSPATDELKKALDEVRRLSSIVDKALELNRLERYTFSFEEIDLGELTRSILKRMEPVFREKNVKVEYRLMDGLVLRGDSFGLLSSIQSLIENSVIYNDAPDKRVEVELKSLLGKAILSVKDNGPGISEQESPFIFERFYRGKTGKRVAGTGLGLYLTKQVVLAHKGSIRLVPEPAGAHFEIQLPIGGAT